MAARRPSGTIQNLLSADWSFYSIYYNHLLLKIMINTNKDSIEVASFNVRSRDLILFVNLQ